MTAWTAVEPSTPVVDSSESSAVGPVPKLCSPLDLELGDVLLGNDGRGWEVLGLDREPWNHGRTPSITTHVTARPVDHSGGFATRRTVTWRGWGPNRPVTLLARAGDVWAVADDPAALVPAPPF